MTFTIAFDQPLDAFRAQLYNRIAGATESILLKITQEIYYVTPVDTGYLQSNWYFGTPPQSRPRGTRPIRPYVARRNRDTPPPTIRGISQANPYTLYRPLSSYLNGQQFLRHRGIYYIDNRTEYGHYVNSAGGSRNRNYRFTERALQALGVQVS